MRAQAFFVFRGGYESQGPRESKIPFLANRGWDLCVPRLTTDVELALDLSKFKVSARPCNLCKLVAKRN